MFSTQVTVDCQLHYLPAAHKSKPFSKQPTVLSASLDTVDSGEANIIAQSLLPIRMPEFVTGRKQFHLLDKDLDASDVKMSPLVVSYP